MLPCTGILLTGAACLLATAPAAAQISLYGSHATVAQQGLITGLVRFGEFPGGFDGVAGIVNAGVTYFELDFDADGQL